MSHLREERVRAVHHWTDRLFSFTTTRDSGFRFRNGEFTMTGIKVDGKPLLRAYSVASPNYEETLEFYSIKVPNGPLTSRLQHLKEGDTVIVGRKATGTLVIDNLREGKNLYLLATGTGVAPFLSIIRDPETYDRFEKIVLVHGCRQIAELAYGESMVKALHDHEFLAEEVKAKLFYYPTVTREPFIHEGRISKLIDNGQLFCDIGLPPLDKSRDRVMLCGSTQMMVDLKARLVDRGFEEGNHGEAGDFVLEKAFAER